MSGGELFTRASRILNPSWSCVLLAISFWKIPSMACNNSMASQTSGLHPDSDVMPCLRMSVLYLWEAENCDLGSEEQWHLQDPLLCDFHYLFAAIKTTHIAK